MPVFADYQTTLPRKYAFGAPVVEVGFDKQELTSLYQGTGLLLEREWPCIPYEHKVTGHHSATGNHACSLSDRSGSSQPN